MNSTNEAQIEWIAIPRLPTYLPTSYGLRRSLVKVFSAQEPETERIPRPWRQALLGVSGYMWKHDTIGIPSSAVYEQKQANYFGGGGGGGGAKT